jgi:hypothetical protein
MDIEMRFNPDAGGIWAGWIIGTLYKRWPMPTDIHFQEILESTLVSVNDGDGSRSFSSLMEWLRDEQYIRFGLIGPGTFFNVVLTEKSLRVLNVMPDPLSGESLGKKISETAADAVSEAAKSQLAEWFGQFLGGLIKNAAT